MVADTLEPDGVTRDQRRDEVGQQQPPCGKAIPSCPRHRLVPTKLRIPELRDRGVPSRASWIDDRPGDPYRPQHASSDLHDLIVEAYKRRNVIERCFEQFKLWRGIATRYDKLALTYRGGVIARAIAIWLKPLSDLAHNCSCE